MHIGTAVKLAFVTAILGLPGAALAANQDPFMTVGSLTSQPIGHYQFCQSHQAECTVVSRRAARVHLTPALWNELTAVNAEVNRTIIPATDMQVYGRSEVWAYPATRGDCEDLALLKRRDLIRRGWPVGALLMTVVRQSNGEGHAVLTVTTDRGDLVLDSLEPRIRLWDHTGYRFIKRQSQFDSGKWVAIDDGSTTAVGSVAR